MFKSTYFVQGHNIGLMGYLLQCPVCNRKIIVETALIGANHNASVFATCAECLKVNDKFAEEYFEIVNQIENWKDDWRWQQSNSSWQLFHGEVYHGAVTLSEDGKWHMGMAGSNGPYDSKGYYQYIFDDFETAKITLEQRSKGIGQFESFGWDKYPL